MVARATELLWRVRGSAKRRLMGAKNHSPVTTDTPPPSAWPDNDLGPTLLTVLFQAADKGSRKRYEPSDKDRQSPPAKKANLSPDRGEPWRSCA